MSEVSIKVNIAGRIYPLTISSAEEAQVRKAEQLIEQSVQTFQKNYAVKDKQDLLAMTALQLAARSLAQQETKVEKVIEKVVETVEITKEVPVDMSSELLELETVLDKFLVG